MLDAQIQDEVLGTLKRDKSTFGYDGKVTFGGKEILIGLTPADRFDSKRKSISIALNRARTVVKDLPAYVTKAVDHATRELLPSANGEWLAEGSKPVSEEEFGRSLSLAEIHFGEDGRVAFWFDDTADHFSGHFVDIRLDKDDRFIDVDLVG